MDRYNDVKKSIQIKKEKINNIKYSCIHPKWLKTYRINRILESLKDDITFLENYNIAMLHNDYYFPEAEILLIDTKNLYNKCINHC